MRKTTRKTQRKALIEEVLAEEFASKALIEEVLAEEFASKPVLLEELRWRVLLREHDARGVPFDGTRSRAEGDKRIVLENHGERQESQHFVGNDQEKTWRVFLNWFQPFRRPTFRQIAHSKSPRRRRLSG